MVSLLSVIITIHMTAQSRLREAASEKADAEKILYDIIINFIIVISIITGITVTTKILLSLLLLLL